MWETALTESEVSHQTDSGLNVVFSRPQEIAEFVSREDKSAPLFILVSGMSESGKSHLGQSFVGRGYGNRMKIYKKLALASDEGVIPRASDGTNNPFLLAGELDPSQQRTAIDFIVSSMGHDAQESGVPVSVVETLKHPWMEELIRERQDVHSVSVFVTADEELRIARQAEKIGACTPEELMALTERVRGKDRDKANYGNLALETTCNVHITNNGNLADYDAFIDGFGQFVQRQYGAYEGVPVDYS